MTPSITAIRLYCRDVVTTARFYEAAFGARLVDDTRDTIMLLCGAEQIELCKAVEASAVAASNSTAFQHCAIVVSDMAAAYTALQGQPGWTPISRRGPETLPAASGGVRAFKFRDADGHPLELLQFRADSVPLVWRDGAGLFLGIDHSAITVADTNRAIAFYAAHDFTVTSRHVNRGLEQERLDDIDLAVVEVTGLTIVGAPPPHLELLCYQKPGVIPAAAPPHSTTASELVFAGNEASPLRDPDGHVLGTRLT